MKRIFPVIFLLLAIFGVKESVACSPLNVPTLVSQSISGPNLLLNWSSNTIYNCNYYIQVEIVCNSANFTGTGPFYQSATITKTSTPFPYPQQSINISGLCAGTTYKFRAREVWPPATFSAWTATFTFTTPGTFVQPTLNVTGSPLAICTPQTSQLNVTINNSCGGSTPTYSWAPAASLSNPTIANPVASPTTTTTYTVTVTGGLLGCWTATGTVTITTAVPPVAGTASVTPNPVCSGTPVTLTLTGYTGTIQWQSGPTSTGPWTNIPSATTSPYTTGPLTSNICFQAVVTGCGSVVSNPVCVTVNPIPVANAGPNAAICSGGNTNLNGSGGGSYSWSPSASLNNPTISNPVATPTVTTTYTLTVTQNSCTATSVVTVTVNPNPTVTAAPIAICNSTCGTLNASGASTYTWSPATGLSATTGASVNACPTVTTTYTITGTSVAGCSSTTTVTVTVNNSAVLAMNFSPVLCFGGNTGSATVTASSGNPPYTYLWTPSSQTNATATGLTAGNYTVTVTTANGCTSTAVVTVTQPVAVTSTQSQVNVLCNGQCTGTATVTPSGGTPPYTFAWSPSGGTNSTATGLCAGNYTCTITDANACTFNVLFTITQPSALNATTNSQQSTCGQPNGSASVTVTGGTPTYTYSWAPSGGTNANATGLMAGNYTVTITDNNGCTLTATVNVPSAASPTATITASTNVSCFGGNNGSATVTVTGGTPAYTYSWAPSGGNGPTATGLTANTYTVTVTDANGCITSTTVTITQPPQLTVTATNTGNVSCFGGNNGSASSNPSGGTTPYSYAWTPSGGNAQNATGLAAGNYTVTVTDANGCTASATVVITQPPVLTINSAGFAALCNGACNGQAVTIPGGGTLPYQYAWSPSGGNGASATGLCAGTYTITVTDANGCTITDTAIVTQPTPLAATTTFDTSHCNLPDGQACVNASGGTGPYTYLWSPSGQTGACATNLTPGQYCVTITDANGCTLTACATVPLAPGVVASIPTIVNPLCFGQCTGTATAQATGGIGPYNYSWAPSGGNAATATGLCAGTYSVTITDASGCISTATCIITQPPLLTLSTSNPATICIGQCVTLTSTVTGGTPTYNIVWAPAGPTVCPTVTTSYTVTVTDANGCTAGPQTATVTVNAPLSVTASVAPNPICIGSSANLSATGSGGSGTGYSFTWLPMNQTGNPVSVSPTATTTYTVVISDNCNTPTATATVTLTVNPLPVPLSIPPASGCAPFCATFTDQTANATAWSWSFVGANPSSATGSPTGQICWPIPGTYDVVLTITDNNGCVGTATVSTVTVLTDPIAGFTPSSASVSILNPEICFTSTAINASNYLWDFGAPNDNNNTSTAVNPCHLFGDTGTYCVQQIVTSSAGCVDSITICVYIEPDFTFYVPNAFTPDGDGNNETFFPKGEGMDESSYELWIFDRWGNLIFHTDNWNKHWDGKVQGGNGELVQEDVYVWRININDYKGNKHKYVGHVSVIR